MKLQQRSPLLCNSRMPMGAVAGKGTFWLLLPSVVYREPCFSSVSDGDFLSGVRHLQLHNLGTLINLERNAVPLPGQGCRGGSPAELQGQESGVPSSCGLGCSEPAQPPAGRADSGKSEMGAASKLRRFWAFQLDKTLVALGWEKKRSRNCCFFSSESCSLGLLCFSKR